MAKRVAIYIRVSTEDQVNGTSLESQIADCRAHAARRGWDVYEVYADEGKSAWRNEYKRRQLARLRQDVQLRRVDGVICWKFDRLARQALLQQQLKYEFRAIDFESATEHVDLKTIDGTFTHGILAQVAQYQSDQHSERVRRALAFKAERGQWVGPVPLGYDKAGDTLAPNSDAAAVVQAYALYATRQESYSTIADALNTAGYRTTDGRLFGRESVRWMLHNRAYCGYVASGGVEYPGQHPAIIEQELWGVCAGIRADRTREPGNLGLRAQGLLTGIVACATCGATMWQHTSVNRQNNPTPYYRCAGNSRRTCQVPMQRAREIDARALDVLAALAIPDQVAEIVLARLQAEVQGAPQAIPDRAAVQGQMQRLTELYIEGRIEKANYEARHAHLATLLLETQSVPVLHVNVERAALFLADVPQMLLATSVAARRSVLSSIFSRFWLAEHTIKAITPREVYAVLISAMAQVCGSVERVADGSQLRAQHTMPLIPPLWTQYNIPCIHTYRLAAR